MNLLLLSGNSLRNKPWIHSVSEHLTPGFDKVKVHDYRHWETGDEFINFDLELSAVSHEIADFQPYTIFAKSVGSVLSIRGIAEQKLNPSALLIVGLPLKVIQSENIPAIDWARTISIPTLIAQNESDPLGSFAEVSKYINEISNPHINVVSLPGSTHEYEDFEALTKLSSILTRGGKYDR